MPRAVTADRGYGQPAFERDLHELGVRIVAIPRQGKTSATRRTIEHHPGFHRLVKWRTGCEGRISYLKRGYGWDCTRLDTRQGAAIWCGHGVFTHNLLKIGSRVLSVTADPDLRIVARLQIGWALVWSNRQADALATLLSVAEDASPRRPVIAWDAMGLAATVVYQSGLPPGARRC